RNGQLEGVCMVSGEVQSLDTRTGLLSREPLRRTSLKEWSVMERAIFQRIQQCGNEQRFRALFDVCCHSTFRLAFLQWQSKNDSGYQPCLHAPACRWPR